MASTYSPNLRIELIGNGEQSNTWGTTTNTNLGTLIEQAISGLVSVDVTAGNVTLTSLNGASDQSRQMIIVATGTPGVTRTITAPAVNKVYIVYNNSNAALSFIASGGTGVSLSVGAKKLIYCDGTNFVEAINSVAITSGSINGTTIGATAASTGAFTTLSASSTVSGTGFSTYLASPPAIGGTTAAAGKFTTLEYTGTLTGSTGILNIGSGQVYKDASGKVGIGTSSPSSVLNVKSSAPIFRLETTGTVTSTGTAYNVIRDSTGSDVFVNGFAGLANCYQFGTVFANGFMRFLTGNQVEAMRIDASGNVGIGTTAAPTKLTVYNATDNSVPLSIQGNTSLIKDYGPSINFQYQNGQVLANIKGAWDATGSGGYGNLIFSTRGADVVTERMRIDSSGNVGIGTTETSNGLLTLVGDGRALFISVKTTGASTEGGEMGWARGTDGTNFWTMDVLAGAAPTIRLINNSGAGVSLTSGATAWAAYSDIRLKTNVMPLRLVLSDILDIECINYHLKDIDTNEDRIRIGVSAQSLIGKFDEVIDVTPKKKDPTEYLSVRYSDMIPYLIKAIQELKAIIDTQQEQINSLLGK